MSPLDDKTGDGSGVWKSGRGKGRRTPKGRQLDDAALAEIRALLGDRPRRRDLLIEHLHQLNDAYRGLYERHLVALAREMKLSMAVQPACGCSSQGSASVWRSVQISASEPRRNNPR